METYEFNITDKEQTGMRVDKLLPELNSDWSRNQIQDWIKAGLVVANDKVVKSNYKVKLNDHIVVTEKEVVEADILPENLNLDIYYEDDDVAVVYKPKGMVVHPSPGHYTNTLVNGFVDQVKDVWGFNGDSRSGSERRRVMGIFG
ncbi:S4 domain-containing protein, partial [Staphylococcus aureus]|uniref:S4 domain-containing protein n=1 Tax=Staphylococcus aureus TaxID=1280 RepID=UPI000DB0837A